jgi:hypothetical protein
MTPWTAMNFSYHEEPEEHFLFAPFVFFVVK